MLIKRYLTRYMEAAGEPAPAGSEPAPAAAAAPATPAEPSSLLAAGAAPTADQPAEFIPEKHRVMKEDGSLDLDASSRKLADAYGSLEKRFGSSEAPPKDASEYKVTVPDALKEIFDAGKDEGVQGFLAGAHAAGLNQSQVDFVMGKYFEIAPQLAAGAVHLDAKMATEELKKTWATESDFKRNVQNAYTGANIAAQKAGLDINEVMNGPLGNSPQFLRLMAALGPEFQEDKAPGGASMVSVEDIDKLMRSEAYNDPRHADHAKVSARVKAHYERKYGTEAAA